MNHFDFLGRKFWQTRLVETLPTTQLTNPVNHDLWVVSMLAINWVHEPTHVANEKRL